MLETKWIVDGACKRQCSSTSIWLSLQGGIKIENIFLHVPSQACSKRCATAVPNSNEFGSAVARR